MFKIQKFYFIFTVQEIPAQIGPIPSTHRSPQWLLRGHGNDIFTRCPALPGEGEHVERGRGGRLDGVVRAHREGHDLRTHILSQSWELNDDPSQSWKLSKSHVCHLSISWTKVLYVNMVKFTCYFMNVNFKLKSIWNKIHFKSFRIVKGQRLAI